MHSSAFPATGRSQIELHDTPSATANDGLCFLLERRLVSELRRLMADGRGKCMHLRTRKKFRLLREPALLRWRGAIAKPLPMMPNAQRANAASRAVRWFA